MMTMPDDKLSWCGAFLRPQKIIGPFSSSPPAAEDRQKHMGRLARNGFSFDVVRRVMDFILKGKQILLDKSIRTDKLFSC